jgi:outer membrane scaffolding protein for murein synthesis (MipA/OmpV family)
MRFLAGLAAGWLLAAPAFAQFEFDAVGEDGSTPNRLRVGGALYNGPRYMGSDERRTVLLPVVNYRWGDGWFAGTGNGIGYEFSRQRGTRYGVRATFDPGRRESRSDALRGMGNIGARPEIGVYFNQALVQELQLTTSLRFGAAGTGLLGDIGLGTGFDLGSGVTLRVAALATLANGHYMQEFFGVTAEQAAASGYPETKASAGVRDVRANLSVFYPVTSEWLASGTLIVRSLSGDARSSPLTREATGVSALLSLSYRF